MSAKDAPGEVKDKNRQNIESSPNFDKSPNISSADDEEQKAIAAAKAAQKESETILIDGIPISADEIKYKASDIKKKGKTEYFVNVEGAEERKKAAIKKAREDALAAERRVKEAKEAAAKAEADRKAQAELKAAEEKRRAKADDDRVIGELKKKASARKKENRKYARQEFKERNKKLFRRIKVALILIILSAAVGTAVYFIINPPPTKEEREAAEYNKLVVDSVEDFEEIYRFYVSQTDRDQGDVYVEACEKAKALIDAADDDDVKFEYALRYADFVITKGADYDYALTILDEYAPLAITDWQKDELYRYYWSIYVNLGNVEKELYYNDLRNELEIQDGNLQ